ncbi:MAG TPA: hypothetical protein VGF67_13175 [Ktedonobacteraceae bacterium]|jgi:hypothetical protein
MLPSERLLHLLEAGLTMAVRNKEKRRTSAYMRSFAHLCQQQGKLDDALNWAREAREGYVRLGVESEVKKMSNLIQELQTGTAHDTQAEDTAAGKPDRPHRSPHKS